VRGNGSDDSHVSEDAWFDLIMEAASSPLEDDGPAFVDHAGNTGEVLVRFREGDEVVGVDKHDRSVDLG